MASKKLSANRLQSKAQKKTTEKEAVRVEDRHANARDDKNQVIARPRSGRGNLPIKKATKNQVMVGRVVSNKLTKTVTVLVSGTKTHPVYQKSYARSKKYLVHDEKEAKIGDLVEIIKVRPISKHKHWQLVKVIGQDIEAVVSKELKENAAQAIAEVLPEEKEENGTT